MKALKEFRSPDGVVWTVDVTNPGASNAIVVFRHPAGSGAHLDRYGWYLAKGPEARNVTGRLSAESVLAMLGDRDLARLFRRSVPVAPSRSIHPAM